MSYDGDYGYREDGILPPFSIEAEQSVLGALLLDNSTLNDVHPTVEADFYRADHRLIFGAIKSLIEQGSTADVVTVADTLTHSTGADSYGGLSYLGEIANNTPSASTARHYAQIVRTHAVKRAMQNLMLSSARRAGNGVDVVELLNMTRSQLETLHERATVPERSGTESPPALVSATDFLSSSRPADWIVNGLVQRGCLYACTGQTNHGKTAVMLVMMLSIAAGRRFCGIELTRSRVAILCGENQDGFRIRMRATMQVLGIEDEDLQGWLYVYPAAAPLVSIASTISETMTSIGEFGAVLIDTSIAYFSGNSEDDNVQAVEHARTMRTLCEAAGRPAVIANSHPTKAASEQDQLIPRGGSSFIDEIDTNLSCFADGSGTCQLHWTRKKRGPDFEPISFEFAQLEMEDCGITVPTVVAKWVDDRREEQIRKTMSERETLFLRAMRDQPTAGLTGWCRASGLVSADGSPMKGSASRTLDRLRQFKLVEKSRRGWYLTKKGEADSWV
jgi:uncharacterized metal-binding protein